MIFEIFMSDSDFRHLVISVNHLFFGLILIFSDVVAQLRHQQA